MHKRTYCLFDHKANIYLNPLVFLNDGEAVRWFTSVVNATEKSNVSLYPKDFTLCYLGTFDDESGKYHNESAEIITGNAVKITEQTYTIKELIKIIQEQDK